MKNYEGVKKESFDKDAVTSVVLDSLFATNKVHEDLGLAGGDLIDKNQFGETVMKVDYESEESVLAILRERRVPIKVVSEEHGVVEIDPMPSLLGILDGLDGSNRYQAGRGIERYGAMFGVFSSVEPCYKDYIACGIMEHSTKRLFYSRLGEGSYRRDANGEDIKINVSSKSVIDDSVRIYINEYWELCRREFKERLGMLTNEDPRAYSTYFSDLASGKVDIVVTATGKKNLELAIGYGLIREAGGVMIDIHGNDIGEYKYHEFGQLENVPIIASCNREMAQALITHVQKFS